MATNALLIEFGVDRRFDDDAMSRFQTILGSLETWKKEDLIEEFRYYTVVTGNRTQRVGLIILEVSNEQLETLVAMKAYGDWTEDVADLGANFTSNRMITLERMMQMMSA